MRYLRTLHIVWSLVRRRVTRRLTRLQTMYNVLKFSENWWNNVKKSIYRNRNATANFVNLIRTNTVQGRQGWHNLEVSVFQRSWSRKPAMNFYKGDSFTYTYDKTPSTTCGFTKEIANLNHAEVCSLNAYYYPRFVITPLITKTGLD